MDGYDAMRMMVAFAKMGSAIQEQFQTLLEDTQTAIEECNSNALAYIAGFLESHWLESTSEDLRFEAEAILADLEKEGITPRHL